MSRLVALALTLALVSACDQEIADVCPAGAPSIDQSGDEIPLYSRAPGEHCLRDQDCIGADEGEGPGAGGWCVTFKGQCATACDITLGEAECSERFPDRPGLRCQSTLGRNLCAM
jgi:hypothetical protein